MRFLHMCAVPVCLLCMHMCCVVCRGQQLVDMKAGDLYIVQYKQVQHLIHNDVAVLV